MDLKMKSVNATIEDTSSSADEFPGTFTVELSNETTDRDGDTLKAADWELPLPDRITFVNDHTHKMSSVVGSAVPELVGDRIVCKGDWGETATAQDTRKIAPHVPYVSVAYAEKSNGKRELINGAFVVVPSNPTARLLASKSVDGDFDAETKAFVAGVVSETVQAITKGQNTFNVTLDDPNKHGLVFEVSEKDTTITVKQHGKVLGTHKFSLDTKEAPSKEADPIADPAEEAAALDVLKAAATEIANKATV